MRCIHVISSIAEAAAGTSYSVPALCDALVEIGVETELHVLDLGGATHRAGARYELHAHKPFPWPRTLGLSPEMRKSLRTRAMSSQIIHGHGLWRMASLYAAAAAHGAPACKWVLSPRGMLEPHALRFSSAQKRIFWTLGQGQAARRAHCLHATSEGEYESLRKLGLRNPVAVIENGIDAASLAPAGSAAQGMRTVLYLGRMHRIKGLTELLRAWSLLESRFAGFRLRLVGPDDGGHVQELQTLAEELKLSRVEFSGAVAGQEKAREFQNASIFVLPSHSENFGLVIAEALAAGLPVVCSKGAPWPALESEGCGHWVQNDPASLARSISSLLAAPTSELAAMGARGQNWMARDFVWKQKAQTLSMVYAWLSGLEARPDCVRTC